MFWRRAGDGLHPRGLPGVMVTPTFCISLNFFPKSLGIIDTEGLKNKNKHKNTIQLLLQTLLANYNYKLQHIQLQTLLANYKSYYYIITAQITKN